MELSQIFENTLYFLALVNPASKILFLSTRQPPYTQREMTLLSLRSSLVAWLILVILTAIGNFLLVSVFNVEIYSLSVAGGFILFMVGLNAVQKGRFFEETKEMQNISEVSVVPLAAPLIAGPGAMTAAISYASIHGILTTVICITIALLVNLAFMLASSKIGWILQKMGIIGPLIRITGLVVTAVAMQMMFSGCASWITKTL